MWPSRHQMPTLIFQKTQTIWDTLRRHMLSRTFVGSQSGSAEASTTCIFVCQNFLKDDRLSTCPICWRKRNYKLCFLPPWISSPSKFRPLSLLQSPSPLKSSKILSHHLLENKIQVCSRLQKMRKCDQSLRCELNFLQRQIRTGEFDSSSFNDFNADAKENPRATWNTSSDL